MGNLVHLHGDSHEQTLRLLPWYVNGTLEDAEAAMIEAHLAECPSCAAEGAREHALRKDVASLALNADHGWAAMREKLEASATRPPAPRQFWRRRVGLGWAVASPLAAAGIAAAIFVAIAPAKPDNVYHALGAPRAAAARTGNAIVLFQADVSTAQMRTTLAAAGARVADGPLASGAYLLRLPAAERPRRIEQLRAAPGVVMAEPVDAPAPQ